MQHFFEPKTTQKVLSSNDNVTTSQHLQYNNSPGKHLAPADADVRRRTDNSEGHGFDADRQQVENVSRRCY